MTRKLFVIRVHENPSRWVMRAPRSYGLQACGAPFAPDFPKDNPNYGIDYRKLFTKAGAEQYLDESVKWLYPDARVEEYHSKAAVFQCAGCGEQHEMHTAPTQIDNYLYLPECTPRKGSA
jgi:hypothetical protein